MDFFPKHPEFVAVVALAAVIAIWRVSRRWDKPVSRETARLIRAINRAPVPQRSRIPLTYDRLRDKIHRDFVSRCRQRMGAIPPDSPERAEYAQDVRRVIEHLIDCENPLLNRVEREKLIDDVIGLLGFGPTPEPPPAPPEGAIQLKVPRRSES
ncbi:MAG TPA: hypothetical protein VMZ71_09910 [Gemmataceae bacterium]|nr:hypothetical protein [Gemmataceae bacterium]